MIRSRGALAVLAVVVAAPLAAGRAEPPAVPWPDTPVARLEALALIETLNAEILASRSATFTLETWCGDHRLSGAAEPKIVARQIDKPKPATAEQRQRLDVGPGEEIKVRHVQLLCGDRVFSEADNWYVPARLTPEMNRLLETTTTPFGKAVQDLHPYRRTFAATVLWHPLPEGWETKPMAAAPSDAGPLAMPAALFEHRAVLYTDAGKPFSEVDEVYQRALLDFPPPAPP